MKCPRCGTEPHTPIQIKRAGMCRWCENKKKIKNKRGKIMTTTLLCKICSTPVTSKHFEADDIITCEKCWVTD